VENACCKRAKIGVAVDSLDLVERESLMRYTGNAFKQEKEFPVEKVIT
jgi:hypothetical protein